MIIEYLKFFGIGILGGIIAGILGIGSGVLILPILLYITNIDIKVATAISTIQVSFASFFGTIFNLLQKTINFQYALIFGISSMISYFFGCYLTHYIHASTIKIIYLFVVILALMLFLIKKKKGKENNLEMVTKRAPQKKDCFKIIPIALISGFIFGIIGVGGGFLYVPLLILLFELPIKIAIGTSLMIVLFNVVPGIIGKLLSIRFDIFIGIAVAVGAIGGVRIGTYLNKKVNEKIIRVIFIVLLAVIIGRVSLDLYTNFI